MLGWTKYLGFSQSPLKTQKVNSADLCTELGQPACHSFTLLQTSLNITLSWIPQICHRLLE